MRGRIEAYCYTSTASLHFRYTRRYTFYAGSLPTLHSLHFFSIFRRIDRILNTCAHMYTYISI